MRSLFVICGVLAASGLLSGLASGQAEPRPVTVGEAVEDRLSAELPYFAGGPFRAFEFTAREGVTYEVVARATGFEPEVRIGRRVGGVIDYLDPARNAGMGVGAISALRAEASGDHVVIVRSLDERIGEFTLLVRETDSEIRRLELGLATAGTVKASEESLTSFPGSAGRELEIVARSRDFDTQLEVGSMSDGRFVPLAHDDDAGGGTDSRIYFTPPTDGEYIARVTAFGGHGGGAYAIRAAVPEALPPPRPLTKDESVTGSLDPGSAEFDGYRLVDYSITAEAGERLQFDLESEDFDAYLQVGTIRGSRFFELVSNDDHPDLHGSGARAVLIVAESGEYIVRARSFAVGETGSYTLTATELEPVLLEPLGGQLTVGEDVTGTITGTDAVLQDGVHYQEWTLDVGAPGRYEFLLGSGEFDTYLIVGRREDGEFVELASNDDWRGALNRSDSRAVVTLPEAGEYRVRVRPFYHGAGAYRLLVREAVAVGAEPAGGVVEVGQVDGSN